MAGTGRRSRGGGAQTSPSKKRRLDGEARRKPCPARPGTDLPQASAPPRGKRLNLKSETRIHIASGRPACAGRQMVTTDALLTGAATAGAFRNAILATRHRDKSARRAAADIAATGGNDASPPFYSRLASSRITGRGPSAGAGIDKQSLI